MLAGVGPSKRAVLIVRVTRGPLRALFERLFGLLHNAGGARLSAALPKSAVWKWQKLITFMTLIKSDEVGQNRSRNLTLRSNCEELVVSPTVAVMNVAVCFLTLWEC